MLVENQKRRQWQCRRGMLELDLILQGFLADGLPGLNEEALQSFDALLDSSDTDLLAWLMGQEKPQDKGLQEIVHLIRTYHQTRQI